MTEQTPATTATEAAAILIVGTEPGAEPWPNSGLKRRLPEGQQPSAEALEGIGCLVLASPDMALLTAMAWLGLAERRVAEVWINAALIPVLSRAGIAPARVGAGLFHRFAALRPSSGADTQTRLSPLLALLMFPLSLPLLALLALRVRFTDGRPVIFSQKRIGQGGKPFTIHKFRTMRVRGNVAQVTPAGERLRIHGLDELPQIVNLLRGEMALIGPRPLPPDEHPRGDGEDAWMTIRECVRPGLTGLYQVCPGRRSLGLAEMCLLDAYWIHNRSLRLNAWILLRTVAAVCCGWGGGRRKKDEG